MKPLALNSHSLLMFHVTSQIDQIHFADIVKRKQRRPLENVWPVQNWVMLKIQGYLKIASLSKVFL